MPNILSDAVLDGGLSVLHTMAAQIFLCSQDPANYTEASSTYALAVKNFGAGNAFGAPTARAPNGRKVTSAPIADGSNIANGTATKWAVCGASGSLYANGALATAQAAVAGEPFTLPAFDIGIPNQ